jgi:hypothetical protein
LSTQKIVATSVQLVFKLGKKSIAAVAQRIEHLASNGQKLFGSNQKRVGSNPSGGANAGVAQPGKAAAL